MNNNTIILNGVIYSQKNLEKLLITNEPKDSWQNAIYYFLKEWFDDNDYILAQTSGSTGKPKSIQLAKASMRNSARMTNKFFGLTGNKTALLCLPASYIAGKMMLVRALVGGFDLITVEPSANPFLHLQTPINFTAITPFQLFHSTESLQQKLVQKIIVGGGPVTAKLEKLADEIPSALYETYGMTETCSHIALRRFNGVEKSDFFTVLNGVGIHKDERECLIINASHLLDDEIKTNDIVELIGTKSFSWLGRADAVINTGGIKIHPEQVEKKLEGIIPTSYFITSLPDELLENKIVLVIESNTYSVEKDTLLKIELENTLGKYEIPKQIFYISDFVYSESNKVLKIETLGLV
ncbi:MAG: AMP-binding protein [Paludibacter sp.]